MPQEKNKEKEKEIDINHIQEKLSNMELLNKSHTEEVKNLLNSNKNDNSEVQ